MRSSFLFVLFFISLTQLFGVAPDRLEVFKITENNLCDDSLDPTGSAYAVIIEDDGKEDTKLKDYTINWYQGTSATGAPVHVGATYDQMADGTYTVQAIHDKSSFTDVVTITIERTEEAPVAYVSEVKNAKNCKENDGRARVRVIADFPSEGTDHSHDNIKDCKHGICWNFVWYEGNNPFIGDVVAVGADANNLKPGTYAVVVTNESDGCQTVVSLTVGLDADEPVVDGNVVANITDCAAPTAGELTAFVTGGKNNSKYEFDWYIGDFIKDAPDFNNQATITGLAAGNYTVVAKEKSSGCSGNPLTLTVEDLTSLPVVEANMLQEQTSCDSGNPNGAVSATADGTTSGFDFEWFEGQNTLGENLIGTSPSLSGLTAGFYTVRATNTSDPNSQNCSSTAEVEVTETLTFPTNINGNVTDQSFCINPNGSISANLGGATSGYTFYWFDGNIASPDINNPDFTGASYENLLAGDYTLIVEDNATFCASEPQVFTVEDQTSTPVIALSSSSELTSCDSPNGGIAVTADGSTAGFDFQWFNGSSTASSDEITPSPGASIGGLSEGTYTVLVTDQTSGCSTTFEHTVIDNRVTPVPNTTVTDQTQCDPINGEIQATVGGATSGYNFYWFDGNIASPDITSPDRTGANINGLIAGDYTLVVEDDASKCVSGTQVLTVDDLTPTISGTISLVASQTSCDTSAPNGELSVSASGGTSYTYEWFTGSDATGASFASGTSVSGLSAQTYTVLITDASGCQDEVSYDLPSEINKPVINIDPTTDITANSICDPVLATATDYNGAIAANVTYDGAAITLSDYRFDWYSGTDTSVAPAFTGTGADSYTDIADGTYTLVVTRITSGAGFACSSDPVTVVVPNERELPAATIALDFAQTSCDATQPNGQLTASALTGGAASADGYAYEWFIGGDTSTPFDPSTDGAVSGTDGEVIGELSAQTYTVLVTDLSSGCQDEVSYDLPSEINKPVINIDPNTDITANTICDPVLATATDYNGAIAANVTYAGAAITLSDYRFDWYSGTDTSVAPAFTGTGADSYTDIADGTYTLVVTRITSGAGFACSSDPVTVVVPNERELPAATIALDFAQTSCDATQPNGQLTASALTGGAASADGYAYEWFIGGDTSTPFDPSTDGAVSGTDGEVIGELSAQTYTVLVTDLSSGCQDEVSYDLPSEINKPVINIDPTTDITANTICDPVLATATDYNGAIAANVTYAGAAITLSDYRFDWYSGTDTSVAPAFTGTGADSYTDIADGTYTLVVTRITSGAGFACSSDPVTVVVPNERELPAATIALDFAQTSCDAAQPNGQLTASALTGGAASADGYAYEWFIGGDTSTPFDPSTDGAVSGTDGEVIGELSAQTYTVLVTDLSSGCQDEVSYDLPSEINKPVINIDPTTDITANTICDPVLATSTDYNGAIAANVTYDGAAITLSDYRFDWYDGNDTSGAADFSAVGANNYTNLAPGEYSLIVTRINTGLGQFCSSEPITVTVTNDITTPVASINKDALQTSCGSPNGQLTASALTGGAASADGYSYEWFVGTDATTSFNNGVDGTVTGADGETIQNVDAGDYAVRVTDLATGCQTLQNIFLDENIIDPVVTLAVTTPFVNCNTDVVITPSITSANAAPNGHDFVWYEGQFTSGASLVTTTDDGASPVLSEPNTGITVYSGYYTVVATDRYTGCISDPATIFVDRPTAQFDILTNVNFLPSTCGVDEGIVTAWVDLDGDADPSASETDYTDYTFEWYLGNPTDLASNYYTNPGPIFNPNTTLAVDQNGIYPGSVPAGAGTDGSDYFGPDNANAGATLFGRESGRYTVVVTNTTTGCREFIGVDIGFTDGAEVTIGDVDVTNSTNCSSPNGSLEVVSLDNIPASQNFNDYIYNWYEGTNESIGSEIEDGGGSDITTATLNQINGVSGLTPGYYTVVPIEDFGSFCRLTPYTVFLDSAVRQPVLTPTITASTSCVGNGEITVAPSKGSGDTTPVTTYSYLWSSGETTATISDKLPGDYAVTVTDDDTDCSVTRTYTILDQRVIPEISNIASTPQFYCNANGTLTIDAADITPGTPDEYTYQLYLNGADAANEVTGSTTITATATNAVFSNLGAGTYYVTATRNVAGADAEGCTSSFAQEAVVDELDPVVLTLSQSANTACDPATNSDGTLTLNMSTPSTNGGINSADYEVTFTDLPADASISSPTTNVTSPYTFEPASGDLITPGSYTVMIRNNVSECTTTRSITVGDNPEPIEFDRSNLIVRGAQYCLPSGSIIVDDILPSDTSDYTYTWYAGKTNYDAGTPIAGVTRSVLDSTKYPSIGAGVYYVVATRGAGVDPGSSCSSVGVRVEIPNAQVAPGLELSQTANTACDPDPNSDATIELNMNTSGSTYAPIRDANYDIRFVTKPAGATVADTLDISSTITFVSKPSRIITPGLYEIEITNRESNCTTTRSITVGNNPEPIEFDRSNLIVRGAQYCLPSGSIVVDDILPSDTSDYTYTWYAGKTNYDAGTPIAGVTRSVLDSTKYPSIGAGVYYVVATRGAGVDPGSSCSSVGVRVEIPNAQVAPGLELSQTANTACDPDPNSDATIELNMNTSGSTYAPIRDANYDIRFVTKPAGATVADTLDISSTITFVSKPSRIITPGLYEIEITNRESNCTTTRSITVGDNPEPIEFDRSNLIVRGAQYCLPSGSIVVDDILPSDTSDYTYTWYAGKTNYDAGTPIAGVTRSVLDSTKYPSIGAGVYYVVATRGAGVDPGSSCSSVGVRVEIPNAQVAPGLELSQTANTACDPDPNSDATIELNMNTSGSTYAPIRDANYDIRFVTKPAGATVADTLDISSTITFVSKPSRIITPGLYEIEITNRESNCTTTRSITVGNNPEPIEFDRSNLIVRGAQYCLPSGSIVVDDILPSDTSDYTYTWYAGKTNYDAGTPIAGVTRSVLDSTKYPSIGAGVYYVVATRGAGVDPGSSCSSVGVRVEIPNAQVAPGLELSQTANTACDPDPNSDATIELNMNTSGSTYAPIRDANYDIRFVTKPAGATVADTLDISSAITFVSKPSRIITPGLYEIEITNRESNCTTTRSITVGDNLEPILLSRSNISIVNATNCSPSGSITIDDISPNTPAGVNDYVFTWYDGETNYDNGTAIPGVTGSVLNNVNYSTIHPGVYYIIASRNAGVDPGSSCISNVVSVEILDDAIDPDIVIVENAPNSSCDPANPNGSISASVNNQTLTDYTYEWFIGLDNTSNPVDASLISGAAGETISGLEAGNYTVRVTDNIAPGETCSNIESFYLTEDFTISKAKNVAFDIVPQSDCFDSGSITVASLSPGVPSDFSYEWYYETYNASGLIGSETSEVLAGQPAGTYYVMITNSSTECITENPIEVKIPNTSSAPAIELTEAKPNTDCDPNTPDGFLEVAADFGQTADYSFTWFRGEMPLSATASQIGDTNRINQLDSGYYTVVVQSNITNCLDTAQFYVEFLPELPKISLSTSPVTNCASPNGSAYAQIYNLEGNFEFNWYIGNSIKSQPDFTSPWVRDLPVGDYIVEAIDLDAPACVSESISFSITELIEVPELKLNQISSNTYCDPEKVNGVAEVILYYVDEDDASDTVFVTSNYEILWYKSTELADSIVDFNGRINTELAATEYTVTYRNVSTDCQWQETVVITEDLTVVQPPEVNITELFDSCEEPNGAAKISSSDLDPSYIYKWYLNEVDETPEFETSGVDALELGTYLVTATDTVSGCISEPSEIEITDGRQAPIINLTLEPESCGDFNGVATISINSDYEYRSIEWETPYGTAYGESYDEFTSGDYSVTVIGSNGCEYTEEFTIESEINVFNGISPNNDGENDAWEIGCIQSFDQNKVEIYNRAGVLVFSTESYDNSSNTFNGYGNRGVYAGEKSLPDGTYFYIIDKGDGSEVVKGYLELFR